MIVVTVEVWPGGDEGRKRQLGKAVITNDGMSKDPKRGNYNFMLVGKRKMLTIGHVYDFPRLRKDVWCLLSQALAMAGKR